MYRLINGENVKKLKTIKTNNGYITPYYTHIDNIHVSDVFKKVGLDACYNFIDQDGVLSIYDTRGVNIKDGLYYPLNSFI